MNKFEATEKFTKSENQAKIYVGDNNEIHAVFHDEHHTLYFNKELNRDEIVRTADVLIETWRKLGSKLRVLEGMRVFASLSTGSTLMGEMKPIFSDISYEEWCSEVYIAKEFYAYQERKRKRR